METIDRDIVLKKISKMKFDDAIEYFLQTLTYCALIKSSQNYFISSLFLSYIKDHLNDFYELIKKNDFIKMNLANLFQINTRILDDNLISIIIDDNDNEELIDFLNENMGFEDFYLNDNIMSFITPGNKNIFEKLKGKNRKYVYSIINSILIPEEEQKEIYDKVLSEFPQKFVDNLFLYCNVINENTPNEFERYIIINKMMFDFIENTISDPKLFYNYLYNVSKIYREHASEKNYYNTFLLARKYPKIHHELLDRRIDNEELYKKLQILTYLPPLIGIEDLKTLEEMEIKDIYTKEINSSLDMKDFDASPSAKVYEYNIFDSDRQIISINEKGINIREADESHFHTLLMMYPEYCEEETINDVVQKINQENHDILLITEGDTLVIWMPAIENISEVAIDRLAEKLQEIDDISEVSISVAIENNGNYTPVPFSTIELLVDYLKNSRKVRR